MKGKTSQPDALHTGTGTAKTLVVGLGKTGLSCVRYLADQGGGPGGGGQPGESPGAGATA